MNLQEGSTGSNVIKLQTVLPYQKPIAPLFQKVVSFFSGAKYDNDGLQKALYEILKDKSIQEVLEPLY